MAAAKMDWRYTATRRRQFLRVLAETYDFDAALAAGPLSWAEACELRALHPEFAERIEEVVAGGYDRLEIALLRAAGLGGKIDPALAQALLKQRRMGKADAVIALRRANGPAPSRTQMMKTILDDIAPLKAAARGGYWNGRGGDAATSKVGLPAPGAPS
jgi:hypothetical protein